MERFLLVCLGGAVGTGARYLVGLWAGGRFGQSFPVGTLLVNLVGCLFIGLVMQLSLSVSSFPQTLRFALTAGVLGGFTTYSAYAWETTQLAAEGARWPALVNFTATTVGGFLMVVLGVLAAKLVVRG
ncbi:MAG: fluoride efflux transporter CrcB [Myxococcales bacterium]|nr:fluoride efflux transporter CrcB [Myxococcales bacterium]